VLLKKAFFCRSSVTEMPPMPMSHLPASMSGIRVFQVGTHSTLTPRLSARSGPWRCRSRRIRRLRLGGVGFVVARRADAQLALLDDAIQVGGAFRRRTKGESEQAAEHYRALWDFHFSGFVRVEED
jgi:hypothetical protein